MVTWTQTGKSQTNQALNKAAGFNIPIYIGWGTGTTAESSTQTALASEVTTAGVAGSARGSGGTVSISTTNFTNDTFSVTQTITSTDSSSLGINEIGLFDQSALGGNMFARMVLPGTISVNDADSITGTLGSVQL